MSHLSQSHEATTVQQQQQQQQLQQGGHAMMDAATQAVSGGNGKGGRCRTRAAARRWRDEQARLAAAAADAAAGSPVHTDAQMPAPAEPERPQPQQEEPHQSREPRALDEPAPVASPRGEPSGDESSDSLDQAAADLSEVPWINVGVLGHVSHGKTTLVRALTGKDTAAFSKERRTGCTIRLGYADAALYRAVGSSRCWAVPYGGRATKEATCPATGERGQLVRMVSFVDCPGHAQYMATMLSGAAAMDAALAVVSAAEPFPQPQAAEHIRAAEAAGIDIVVVQNKVDLAGEGRSLEQALRIRKALPGAVIVPCAAARGAAACAAVAEELAALPVPDRDRSAPALLCSVRSFDVTTPGGGKGTCAVVGGALLRGTLGVGDAVELSPAAAQGAGAEPLRGTVLALHRGGAACTEAGPGGLLGVQVSGVDAAAARNDGLAGRLLGPPGSLPPAVTSLMLRDFRTVCEAQDAPAPGTHCEVLCRSHRVGARLLSASPNSAVLELAGVVCAAEGDTIVLATAGEHTRLVGSGVVAGARTAPAPAPAAAAPSDQPTVAELLAMPFKQVWKAYGRRLKHAGAVKDELRKDWGPAAPDGLREGLQQLRDQHRLFAEPNQEAEEKPRQGELSPERGQAQTPTPQRQQRRRVGLSSNGALPLNPEQAHDPHYRYRMPAVDTAMESRGNGAQTAWRNADEIADRICRCPEALTKAVAVQLATTAHRHPKQERIWILKGHHPASDVQRAVYVFISSFVLCPRCRDPGTKLCGAEPVARRAAKVLRIDCGACSHCGPIAPPRKLDKIAQMLASAAPHAGEAQGPQSAAPMLPAPFVAVDHSGGAPPAAAAAPVSRRADDISSLASTALPQWASIHGDWGDDWEEQSGCGARPPAPESQPACPSPAKAVEAEPSRRSDDCAASSTASSPRRVCRRRRPAAERRLFSDSESDAASGDEAAPPSPGAAAADAAASDPGYTAYRLRLAALLDEARIAGTGIPTGPLHLPRINVELPPRHKHSYMPNFAALARATGRPLEELRTYLESTLHVRVRVDANGCAKIDKPWRQPRVSRRDVEKALASFARAFLQCWQCLGGDTEQQPGRRLSCRKCGAVRALGPPPERWEMDEGERRRRERTQRQSRFRHGHAAAAPGAAEAAEESD